MNVVHELSLVTLLDEVIQVRPEQCIFRVNRFVAMKRTIKPGEVDGVNLFGFLRMLDHKGCFGGQQSSDNRTWFAAL